MSIIMNHHCKTCNLDFTTSSNLRKHERTEKHLANCRLLTMVEPTTSDQKIKELEEKLAKAEQTILLQTQLIQSYQVIVLLTGLPDPMLPGPVPVVSEPVREPVPEPVPVVEKDRRRGRPSKPAPIVEVISVPVVEVISEPVPEPIVEVISEPVPEPIVEVIPEPVPIVEVIPEPVPVVEVISEPKPVKKLKKAKVKTEEEQIEDDQCRIQHLKEFWDELETRLSFQEIQQEIESYQAPNEVLQKFKDSYYSRFMNDGYMDRRPKEELKPEKPRRKLKIIDDPPKDLEAEVFKPEPKPEPEKPRRKLKIIEDPPKISEATRKEMRQINNDLMDYEKATRGLDEHSKEARDARLKFNLA